MVLLNRLPTAQRRKSRWSLHDIAGIKPRWPIPTLFFPSFLHASWNKIAQIEFCNLSQSSWPHKSLGSIMVSLTRNICPRLLGCPPSVWWESTSCRILDAPQFDCSHNTFFFQPASTLFICLHTSQVVALHPSIDSHHVTTLTLLVPRWGQEEVLPDSAWPCCPKWCAIFTQSAQTQGQRPNSRFPGPSRSFSC